MEEVEVDEDIVVIFINGLIIDFVMMGDYNMFVFENMDYGVSVSLWKKVIEWFYNLGMLDKFFNDWNVSEWVSFMLMIKNYLFLNEIVWIII